MEQVLATTNAELIVIATPIGNLEDICARAIISLQSADLILVEDTRHFAKLASRYNIKSTYRSNHEHNEKHQVEKIIALLEQDKKICLVSDAGTPTISDPGYRIVKACHEHNLKVSTVPGPCAAIAALSISGLPSDEFCFRGFLPVKSGQKEKLITSSLDLGMTCIFYESTHRILKTTEVFSRIARERDIFIVRELTKKFEEYYKGSTEDVYQQLIKANSLKGEFVIVLSKEKKITQTAEE